MGTKELKSLMKDPIKNPKVTVAPNESNILEVHYVIEGSEKTPYAGGIYHGKLIFPKDYPLKPPSVIMLTKNGRFQPNRRLCLSMSDFHPESWNPMWSVSKQENSSERTYYGGRNRGGSPQDVRGEKIRRHHHGSAHGFGWRRSSRYRHRWSAEKAQDRFCHRWLLW